MLAASNRFDLGVIGAGAPAARPYKSIDPIFVATQDFTLRYL